MNEISVKQFSIAKLNSLFSRGIFAIPKLQRDFVWNTKKACDLLDSIYNKYPIGTIMVWDADKNKSTNLNQDLTALPPYNSNNNKRVYFIIDGQQRLSVLYRVFDGSLIYNSNDQELDFSKIYFNLDKKDSKKFVYYKRNKKENLVPVSDILSPHWNSKFRNYAKYKKKIIADCRERIRKYNVFVQFIKTKQIPEVKESFIRINSTGTPLSSADKAFTIATSFNLKHRIKTVKKNFTKEFNKLPRIFLLRTIAMIYEAPQLTERGINSVISKIENSKEEQKIFDKIWNKLNHSFGLAIDHLINNMFVLNYDLLPSNNMIPILASFYYHNSNYNPNSFQKQQLKKWFWYSGISGRYSGAGYHKNLMEDYDFAKKLGEGKKKYFSINERVNVSKFKFTDYASGSGVNSAFFCLLASRKPKYLDGGDSIPLEHNNTLANKKNKHHIFPKAHLRGKGFSKNYYNSIGNICYLVWNENIKVGAKHPRIYLEEFKRKQHFRKVLRSHLIPVRQEYGLWDSNTQKGYKKFLNRRIELICKEFEKLAGTKLFEE